MLLQKKWIEPLTNENSEGSNCADHFEVVLESRDRQQMILVRNMALYCTSKIKVHTSITSWMRCLIVECGADGGRRTKGRFRKNVKLQKTKTGDRDEW
jgi:hypothetical protein